MMVDACEKPVSTAPYLRNPILVAKLVMAVVPFVEPCVVEDARF
jgi:hypothetical protein